MTKICKKCKKEKQLDCFHNYKSSSDGKKSYCKDCIKIYTKLYLEKNKDEIKKRKKIYYYLTIEKQKEISRKYYSENKEKYKKYNSDNREAINKRKKEYRKINESFRIADNLRRRLNKVIKKNNAIKSKKTIKLLGCSILELKLKIEGMFKPGMSWDNYGYNGWHIDHIIPCASFDLTDPEQQKACFHYNNLQPLWRIENQSKNKKLIYNFKNTPHS